MNKREYNAALKRIVKNTESETTEFQEGAYKYIVGDYMCLKLKDETELQLDYCASDNKREKVLFIFENWNSLNDYQNDYEFEVPSAKEIRAKIKELKDKTHRVIYSTGKVAMNAEYLLDIVIVTGTTRFKSLTKFKNEYGMPPGVVRADGADASAILCPINVENHGEGFFKLWR